MLRLDLDDTISTVLIVDPMKGVKLRKDSGNGLYRELFIEVGSVFCDARYDSEESRDAAYKRILNKINEYLFPQKECFEEFVRRDKELGPICPNDFAVPKKEEMDDPYQS